jgi:hypothetical protein
VILSRGGPLVAAVEKVLQRGEARRRLVHVNRLTTPSIRGRMKFSPYQSARLGDYADRRNVLRSPNEKLHGAGIAG